MANKASERAIASASESTRRRNPHLFGLAPEQVAKSVSNPEGKTLVEVFRAEAKGMNLEQFMTAEVALKGRRLRQDPKPLMNKLETEYFNYLNARLCHEPTLRPQARRYKLANGAWYKPDITACVNGRETAWECKGPKQMKSMARAMLTIKVAAHNWPEVRWMLVWKEQGRWMEQEVLP